MARKSAEEEQQLQEEEAAATKLQSVQRAKVDRQRVEKKKHAVPVVIEDIDGVSVWEIVLTKHDNKQKYGFSHANAKVQFIQEYVKALEGSKSKKENKSSNNESNDTV